MESGKLASQALLRDQQDRQSSLEGSRHGVAFSGKEHGKIACRCKVRRQTWNSSNDIYRKSAGTCPITKERTFSQNYAHPSTTRWKPTQTVSQVKKTSFRSSRKWAHQEK